MIITALIAALFIAIIFILRDAMIRRHLKSNHVIQVFRAHDNHIQLNETTSLIMQDYIGEPDKCTESYLVSLVVAEETIDTARIDHVLNPLLTNYHSELKFKGPWHQTVAKQFVPFSKAFHRQQEEKTQEKIQHVQKHLKQSS